MALRIESDLVVDLKRIDEGHQPSQQLLVDGVVAVGIERGSISELHDAAKLVVLRARRDVVADQGFDEPGNLPLQSPYLLKSVVFLFRGDSGLPAKGEGMDDHAASVTSSA